MSNLSSEIQMSGPNRNQEFIFQPPEIEISSKNHQHLLRSGQLGMCNDPYCTTCPMSSYNVVKPASTTSDDIFHHAKMLHAGDAKRWAMRFRSTFLLPNYIHEKHVQRWNKFFVCACSLSVLLDPLFFFLLYVQESNKCIVLNWTLTIIFVVLRSITDIIYLLHILLQFKLAYLASGDLEDDPKMNVRNYVTGYFIIDLLTVLPLPQIIILVILPDAIGSSANYAKTLVQASIVIQLIPKLYRFLPLVAGSSPTAFIFESAWFNFAINLVTFILAGHVVGSLWYLFSIQRVKRCFQEACKDSNNITRCFEFIDCGHGNDYAERFGINGSLTEWEAWKNNKNAKACFEKDGFDFGIYGIAVNLITKKSVPTRYVYSLFWGFQQISTLAGNQVPSSFVGEVIFTMLITGIGLLLIALLIGNIQNFLQALGRRKLEMSLRRRDVEKWMRRRRLPKELQSRVRSSERNNWAATGGVNEEVLMENFPEDLQRQIRRHLFKFVEKVPIFQLMDEPIIDAILEKLKRKTYIKGSKILYHNGLVDKMVFIIRGRMESVGEDGINSPLSEGNVCGEELLTWCLEHSSVNNDGKRIRIPGHRLLSNREVSCTTDVEAFILWAADLEQVMSLFARSPRVQGAIRYESPYWRGLAAKRTRVAWRYRKKRIN